MSVLNKSVAVSALGNTAVWTPVTGKKFRAFKIAVQITADAATTSGAEITIDFLDGAASIGVTFTVYVPAAGGTILGGNINLGTVDLGQGYESVLANNVLNVNLSAALSAGKVNVIVTGDEKGGQPE